MNNEVKKERVNILTVIAGVLIILGAIIIGYYTKRFVDYYCIFEDFRCSSEFLFKYNYMLKLIFVVIPIFTGVALIVSEFMQKKKRLVKRISVGLYIILTIIPLVISIVYLSKNITAREITASNISKTFIYVIFGFVIFFDDIFKRKGKNENKENGKITTWFKGKKFLLICIPWVLSLALGGVVWSNIGDCLDNIYHGIKMGGFLRYCMIDIWRIIYALIPYLSLTLIFLSETLVLNMANKSREKGENASGFGYDGYYDLALHVIFLLVTFGIYRCMWIYRTTAYLNNCEGEEYRNPVTKLLLCLFIPFYEIYWVYQSSQRIDKMAHKRGVQSDISALCLVLEIFIGIVPPIIMQNKINEICKHRVIEKTEKEAVEVVVVEESKMTTKSTVEELREYKALLDEGIITEEEFNEKKREILGL